MRFGGALPSSVLRLEYDYYIYDDFTNWGVDEYRADAMLLKKNLEKTIQDIQLRRYWRNQGGISFSSSLGAKIPQRISTDVDMWTYSNQSVGWWAFRVYVDGVTCSPPFTWQIIRLTGANFIGIEIAGNNRVMLIKEISGARTALIDTGIDLTTQTFYYIEVTRDIDGNYEIWIDDVSKGTVNDAWLPSFTRTQFHNDSSTDLYIRELILNAEKIT